MALSNSWERVYQEKRHLSRWPWTSLISRVFTYCPAEKRGLRVLELGCGVGANIPFFTGIETDYYAIEGSQSAVKDILEKFPALQGKIACGDFTKELPFSGAFDLVVDRAALTHNEALQISKTLKMVHQILKPGGIYIGVDWYSSQNRYATRGNPLAGDPHTRVDFSEGPYRGIGKMRFSSQDEMLFFFEAFKVLELTHDTSTSVLPPEGSQLSSWHIVAARS